MGITTHSLNLTCMQGLRQCKGRQALRPSKLPGGHKTARKVEKLEGRRPTGGKKARKE